MGAKHRRALLQGPHKLVGTREPLRFHQKGEPGDATPLTLCLSSRGPRVIGARGVRRSQGKGTPPRLVRYRGGEKRGAPPGPPRHTRPSPEPRAAGGPAEPAATRGCQGHAPPAHAQGAPRRYRSQRRSVASGGGGSAARPDMAPGRKAVPPPSPPPPGNAGGERTVPCAAAKETGGAAGARTSFIGKRLPVVRERGPAPGDNAAANTGDGGTGAAESAAAACGKRLRQ